MTSDRPATERVRLRLVDWVTARKHGAQRQLLDRIQKQTNEIRKDSWLSGIVNGQKNLTLDDLDLIADAMDVPPGELVRKHDRNYWELTMEESKVVEWLRLMTSDSRRHFVAWVEPIRSLMRSGPQRARMPKALHATAVTDAQTADSALVDSARSEVHPNFAATLATLEQGLALLKSGLSPETGTPRAPESPRDHDPRKPHRSSFKRTKPGRR